MFVTCIALLALTQPSPPTKCDVEMIARTGDYWLTTVDMDVANRDYDVVIIVPQGKGKPGEVTPMGGYFSSEWPKNLDGSDETFFKPKTPEDVIKQYAFRLRSVPGVVNDRSVLHLRVRDKQRGTVKHFFLGTTLGPIRKEHIKITQRSI